MKGCWITQRKSAETRGECSTRPHCDVEPWSFSLWQCQQLQHSETVNKHSVFSKFKIQQLDSESFSEVLRTVTPTCAKETADLGPLSKWYFLFIYTPLWGSSLRVASNENLVSVGYWCGVKCVWQGLQGSCSAQPLTDSSECQSRGASRNPNCPAEVKRHDSCNQCGLKCIVDVQ